MILLHKISLFQFRNYTESSFSIDQAITCITGKNGSGKTNLLDAIYTLCYTKSYFSAQIQPTVMQGTEGYRIEGHFSQSSKNELVICKYKNAKKEISCGGLVYEKQTDHIGKYAAVMIAPDDIEMINEGSGLRRKFMDGILSQCDRRYLEELLNYQKVLQQRNAWLKLYGGQAHSDGSILNYYNSLLTESGTYIYQARKSFWIEFSDLLQKYYQLLSGGKENISIDYESDLHTQTLDIWLEQQMEQDLRYQRTLRGIHKDDVQFLLNGNTLKNYGSQGQKKSYLFSLKLSQFEFISRKMGRSPILLLDDIFEKLDQQRMEALLRIIREPIFEQVILTDTHADRVQAAFGENNKIGIIQLI